MRIGNDEDWLNETYNSLDMDCISIDKHEMEICQLFYFQVRESPAPLNIPTPTPAPNHLLGGHNELGGKSVE